MTYLDAVLLAVIVVLYICVHLQERRIKQEKAALRSMSRAYERLSERYKKLQADYNLDHIYINPPPH